MISVHVYSDNLGKYLQQKVSCSRQDSTKNMLYVLHEKMLLAPGKVKYTNIVLEFTI
jgi:hypothetical protein